MKSTITYLDTLSVESAGMWTPVEGLEGMAEELTLSIDDKTGDYTRLTRFTPGADTKEFGEKQHTYPEDIYIGWEDI